MNLTQAEYKKTIKEEKPKCWDIYMANVPKLEGDARHVQYGYRPVLIISNNRGNSTAPTVNVFTFTSKGNKRNLPVHVEIDGFGLPVKSTLICECPRTIGRNDLCEKIGHVDDYITRLKIQHAVMIQFGVLSSLQ